MEAKKMIANQVVIFGGTGNLTFHKLLPALHEIQMSPDEHINELRILAIGRRELDDAGYRERVKQRTDIDDGDFTDRIGYHRMVFEETRGYERLHERLDEGPRVFYLATSPEYFGTIAEHLRDAGLVREKDRVVFEKPFGSDLASATAINEALAKTFHEENIYRIDHYLGKEMIQNIMVLRFGNRIFDSVWQNYDIEHVQIIVKEKEGIGERGGYYDDAGALRDMVQSHLLQMLALVAMEKPLDYETEYIRDEKVKVLRSLRIENPSDDLVFGQYEGYLEEEHVAPDSDTESFVALKMAIDNPRWRGVPFYLKTGKALEEKRAEIIIRFKCGDDDYSAEQVANNLLILKIQPEEGVYFRINVKEPGMNDKVIQESMEYCQSCKIGFKSIGAYEKLLADVLRGERTLFTRWDELEQAWRVIDEIRHWRNKYQLPLHKYEQHTEGPQSSLQLLSRDGLYWINGRVVD